MSRWIIWAITLVGILPVCLIAFGLLLSSFLAYRELKAQRIDLEESGESVFIIGRSFSVGPHAGLRRSIKVSPDWRPAVTVLVSGIVLMFGSVAMLPRTHWKSASGTLADLPSYITRLMNSESKLASLQVQASKTNHVPVVHRVPADPNMGFGYLRPYNELSGYEFADVFESPIETELAEALVSFAGRTQTDIIQDRELDGTRFLSLAVGEEVDDVARRITGILEQVYGISSEKEIIFTFDEPHESDLDFDAEQDL